MPQTPDSLLADTRGAKPEQNRAVFLDLNGTIVLPLKQQSLDEMTSIPGADLAITRLLGAGFLCPIVTVQARIAKGLFTEAEFRAWFADFFGNLRLDVKGPYICPHRYGDSCACQKPNSFLYEQAAADWSLDLRRSYTIGDSPQDVEAACRFGGTGCLVRTGWAGEDRFLEEARPFAAFIGDSISEAVEWVVNREQYNGEQRQAANRSMGTRVDC
jgi:D-glycero-D-manno-heptose 1,7-bisphosphate phosphatase